MIDKLNELCMWLSHQKGMMSQDYAKELAKIIIQLRHQTDHIAQLENKKNLDLRDYFAGQVLAGGLEQGVEDDMQINWWHEPKKIAERAYAIADAMIKENKK